MFITTANTLNIPPPLMDRMEIIRIAGYTEDEKVEIARKHLIPHAIAKHGLTPDEWAIDDEALLLLIRRYTREAGVRNLERELSTLIRKAVKELTLAKKTSITVDPKVVPDYLGVPKFRYGEVEDEDQVGVVTGLAWTDVGGELLTIEAAMMPGKGKMTVTGNLRDVMKESISAAASYVRMRAIAFGIEPRSLVRKPEAIEWDEEKAKPTQTSVTTEPPVEEDSSTLTAHQREHLTKTIKAAPMERRLYAFQRAPLCSAVLEMFLTSLEQRE